MEIGNCDGNCTPIGPRLYVPLATLKTKEMSAVTKHLKLNTLEIIKIYITTYVLKIISIVVIDKLILAELLLELKLVLCPLFCLEKNSHLDLALFL